METFTAIRIETLISGAWHNLTPDVKQNPPPRMSGMGGLGFGVLDRVGGAATFTFTLDNSAANSAGTLGYYTPGGSSSGAKIGPGYPVHVYFEYDGRRQYKFYGTVNSDGIQVAPGQYGERTVSVTCSNWLAKAAKHKLDLLGYQTNQTFDSAFEYVLGNMYAQPQNTYFYTGQETFPTVFDVTRTNTTALGELNKLVYSEWGRAYITGDFTAGETLVLEDNGWYGRTADDGTGDSDSGTSIPVKQSDVTSKLSLMTGGTDNLLLMTGATDDLLLNETQRAAFAESDIESMQWSYGQNIFNHVVFKTYPRSIDSAATTVLWALPAGEPIELTAGQQLTDIRGSYTDPSGGFAKVNGIEMVTPVSGTDYAAFANSDGTGTNYTTSLGIIAEYGTAEVKYTLTNNAAATIYVTVLQARGKGVYIYDTNDKAYDNASSQILYDFSPVEIDMPYLNNINGLVSFGYNDTIWTGFLNYVHLPVPTISGLTMTVNKTSKQMLAFMYLEPRDFIIINETMTASGGVASYAAPWLIQSYDFEIINGTTVKWYLNLKVRGIA